MELAGVMSDFAHYVCLCGTELKPELVPTGGNADDPRTAGIPSVLPILPEQCTPGCI